MADAFADLALGDRWVGWREETRGGKPTKIPYSVRAQGYASATDPATWVTRAEARAWADKLNGQVGGIGITLGDGLEIAGEPLHLCGVDLDSSLDATGALAAWAGPILAALGTYAETSPSGHGVKAFFYVPAALVRPFLDQIGVTPGVWGCRRSLPGLSGADHGPAVEVYTAARYFTVTDQAWPADRPATHRIARLDAPRLERLAALIPGVSRMANGASASWEGGETFDDSRSARAWRAGCEMGAINYEAMRDGLRRHPDPGIRTWVQEKGEPYGERGLHRIWDRGVIGGEPWSSAPDEPPEAAAAPSPGGAETPDDPNAIEIFDFADDYPSLEPPREWLLGWSICRGQVTTVANAGGGAKTSLLLLMAAALATGEPLTGEHVFERCRVLILSFEEDRIEVRRRLRAICLRYGISLEQITGKWLRYATLGPRQGKLAAIDKQGHLIEGPLKARVRAAIRRAGAVVTFWDPLVRVHGVTENDNTAMAFVAEEITDVTREANGAAVIAAHDRKGDSEPGDSARLRGGGATRDAHRLNYTLTWIAEKAAAAWGITDETELGRYFRYDSSKVNLCPPQAARWYYLCSQPLGNGDEIHPNGDFVQVVEPWTPPPPLEGTTEEALARIVAEIGAGLPDGQRYSDANRASQGVLAAWRVAARHYPDKTEAQCRQIIRGLITSRRLAVEPYQNPVTHKLAQGLKISEDDAAG
jgi:hypothetical protein